MSKFSKLLTLLLFTLSLVEAQDSVVTRIVTPGILHTTHTRTGPFVVNALEIDLTAPRYRLESYRPSGLILTSQQAKENTDRGHTVVAAVNADFFSFKTGWPLSNQVVNGKFVLGVRSKRSHLAVDRKNKPHFERLSFRGFILASGLRLQIDGVNKNRSSDETVFYNSYWGPTTRSDSVGVKLVLRLLEGGWVANDTMLVIVVGRTVEGAAAIPADGGVLSGSADVPVVKLRDTLKMFLGFSGFRSQVTQVIGGAGRILESGRNVSETNVEKEGLAMKFLTDRHPRTFVGFNRDTTKLFLYTVDGRQTSSVGMQFTEMAQFLSSLGVWNAINLDGGGSTTMVVQTKVVNSPSDKTGERAVANSLQVISSD